MPNIDLAIATLQDARSILSEVIELSFSLSISHKSDAHDRLLQLARSSADCVEMAELIFDDAA